jgi:hypothetical protein
MIRRGPILLLLLAGAVHAQTGAPPVILEDKTPGIGQPFDYLTPDRWGRNRAEYMIGPWIISGGVATATGNQPRLIYSPTDKGYPPDPIGTDDAVMPVDDGWVATIVFAYLDTPHVAATLAGSFHELQFLGPASTGIADQFIVHLRNHSTVATVTLAPNVEIRYTVHYHGVNGGNVLDIWIDDSQVVNGYDLDIATPGQPFDLSAVQLAGGGSGSWTVTYNELFVGLLDSGPEIISSAPTPAPATPAVIFTGELGREYMLEYTGDLVHGAWFRCNPVLTGDGALLRLYDTDGPAQHRAYRVLQLP